MIVLGPPDATTYLNPYCFNDGTEWCVSIYRFGRSNLLIHYPVLLLLEIILVIDPCVHLEIVYY